ncbi:MAG TPA: CDP-alcohol phosphatidyltransferase family protein [Acidobacteriota bacterium]
MRYGTVKIVAPPRKSGDWESGSYRPRSRRPISDLVRRTARGAVRFCVAVGIHPDLISYTSILAASAAGVCFWQSQAMPSLLIAAVVFCYLRLWLNMLDGMVALASGTGSPAGEIVNELPDRLSDVITFAGVAHSGLCRPLGGYWSAIFALLVAYVGTLGQAVGAQREFSGVMSKPWRIVALHLGGWLTLGLLWWGSGQIIYAGLSVLDWTNLSIIFGCVETIGVRLIRIRRVLAGSPKKPASSAAWREA